MDATERAKEIADRFEDGLSRDAVRDLASDIADAIRAAEDAVREECAAVIDAYAVETARWLAVCDEEVREETEHEVATIRAIAQRIREGKTRE